MAVPNLTRDDARARAELLHVESYDVELDLTDGGGKPSERTFRSTTDDPLRRRAPGAETFIDVIADRLHAVTLNGATWTSSAYRPEDGIALTGLADRQRAGRRRRPALHEHRRGAAPLRRPARRRGLPLLAVRDRRRQADVRLLRPARPQGDVHLPRHRARRTGRSPPTAGVERTSRSCAPASRCTSPRPRGSARTSPPWSPGRTTWSPASTTASTSGLWCRKTLAEHLDADDAVRGHQAGLRLVPRATSACGTRSTSTTSCSCRSSTPARWRTPAASRSARTTSSAARSPTRATSGAPRRSCTRWRTCGSATSSPCAGGTTCGSTSRSRPTPRCCARPTRPGGRDAWTTFANVEKTWAYRQDQLPSTHPIATDAPDVQTAEVNFDGITYAKGASVLKQLGAYVGVEAFLAGLRDVLRRARVRQHHAGRPAARAGEVVRPRPRRLVEAVARDRRHQHAAPEFDGRRRRHVHLASRSCRARRPRSRRPTRCARTGWPSASTTSATARWCAPSASSSTSPASAPRCRSWSARRSPALLLVNDDDLTYCKLRLDEPACARCSTGGIGELDRLAAARAVLVGGVGHDPRRRAGHPRLRRARRGRRRAETDIGVVQSLTRQALRALEIYADPAWAPQGYAALADAAAAALRPRRAGLGPPAGLGARAARRGPQRRARRRACAALLDGSDRRPTGWRSTPSCAGRSCRPVRARRARRGRRSTPSSSATRPRPAQRHAATARALRPTAEAKAEAWRLAVEDDTLPNAMQRGGHRRLRAPDPGRARRALRRSATSPTIARRLGAADQRARAERRRRAVPDLDVDDRPGDGRRGRRVPGRRRRAAGAAPAGQRGPRRRRSRATGRPRGRPRATRAAERAPAGIARRSAPAERVGMADRRSRRACAGR